MLAITLNNNFLKLALPESQLFKKISLDPSVVDDCKIIDQEKFVALVEKALADVELPSKEIIIGLNEEKTYLLESASVEDLSGLAPYEPDQLYTVVKDRQIVAVEKALVDSYSSALSALGFEVRGFVPLALSLANLTKEKEAPHLIVCLEDEELVFVLVKEGGAVPFSATYPAKHILEATIAVLEFVKEKYQTTDIKKVYVCGEKSDQVAKTLKEAKLLVEELKIDPPEFCKLVSLLQFDDRELVIRPGVVSKTGLPRLPTLNLPPLTIPLTLAAFLLAAIILGGLAFFRTPTSPPIKTLKTPETTPSAEEATTSAESASGGGPIVVKETPEATETAEPSVVSEAEPEEKFNKSVYKIQVLNAKGVQGVAARTRDKLEELGYQVVDIDNTSWKLNSTIKVKEGNEALLEALTADLESDYEFGDPEVLEADSEFAAIVILGSR